MKEEIARALLVLDSAPKPAQGSGAYRIALNEQFGPFLSGIDAAIFEWLFAPARPDASAS